ncbi:MAG: PIN domain-containing protein [Halodesulfurarchaeum sp.]|nr:PIN domain-containing protein [Halodesulfurarchaeum sp.]
MYLDTDTILARLKEDDWLSSDVDIDAIPEPITSVATAIEIQYVMESDWDRRDLATGYASIENEGVVLVALTREDIEAAGTLREKYDRVGVFDSIHLGAAYARGEPIVSTDTLFPEISEVEHVDPRELK